MEENKLLRFLAPSKTFLLGEYAALSGGPALVITTPPYFSLEIKNYQHHTQKNIDNRLFDKKSPAGLLWAKHKEKLNNISLIFSDPHEKAGGFGASSAQFALLAVYLGLTRPTEIWTLYQSFASKQRRMAPSGADVIAQCLGGLVFFHPADNRLEKYDWPFPDLSIALIHTGKKIATHTHLDTLSIASDDLNKLREIVITGYKALVGADKTALLKAIFGYAEALHLLNLTVSETRQLLEKLNTCDFVCAAKGCGALGADVVLAIIEKKQQENFFDWIKQERLRLVYCDNHFAKGIRQ